MNCTLNPMTEAVVETPPGMTELVRGDESRLIQRITPLLRERSVALDLSAIDRIDAAGIAALISLYGIGRTAGHRFTVRNASARVAEILTLVGLDPILVSHDAVWTPQSASCFERPAA